MNIDSRIELHTGNTMPIIGLGTWQIKGNVRNAVSAAISAGYKMIDTSGDYGSQVGIGEALRETAIPRSMVYIVSKVEETDDAYDATTRNLDELGLDYVDLMLVHRPPKDGEIMEELWRDLIRAWQEGRIRDIGVSNFSEDQIRTIVERTGVKPVVNQIEWSPFGWSKRMADFCQDNSIIIQSYSPLTRAQRLYDTFLNQIATKYDKSPAQILIRWNLQHGWVPLPKSDNPLHIKENIDVFDFELSQTDMVALDSINEEFSALAERPIYQLHREKGERRRYRELIKSVKQYSGFSDAESKDALDSAVATIAAHLEEAERLEFASHLPAELKEIALAIHPSKETMKQDLFEQFTEIQEVDKSRAKKQLLSAWKALKGALSSGEIDHIRTRLPDRAARMLS